MIKFQVIFLLLALAVAVPARQLIQGRYSALFDDDDFDIENDLFVPPYKDYPAMARFLVHELDWTAMGTISTLNSIKGFPMVNVISIADSARGDKSTGRIFFYLTDLDFTGIDLKSSNRLTALFSMEQSRNCSDNNTDAMEPTCARVMVSGKARQLSKDDADYDFAKSAMFSRHPAAKKWISTHNFYLCELEISQICVLDYYGGPHYVTAEEYYKADPEKVFGTKLTPYNDYNLQNIDDELERPHHKKSRSLHIKVRRDVDEINIEV
ncbi:protein CREG1 [Phlebotomus argentipes]|uniref:protein CREG1 n=1 Tax=Phlebotomus argentipes TaxID=94469 RepID=UPI002893805B|nr:protein CREG1 [Phlebotomus argentipes]